MTEAASCSFVFVSLTSARNPLVIAVSFVSPALPPFNKRGHLPCQESISLLLLFLLQLGDTRAPSSTGELQAALAIAKYDQQQQ